MAFGLTGGIRLKRHPGVTAKKQSTAHVSMQDTTCAHVTCNLQNDACVVRLFCPNAGINISLYQCQRRIINQLFAKYAACNKQNLAG